jgi:hypothetical protein
VRSQETALAKLREVLDQPDALILVGSGVSLWSGLPGWGSLLTSLADFLQERGLNSTPVRQEIREGNLLLAASYAVHQLHSRELGAFLRQTLNHPHAAPSKLHDLIAELGPSCFVTTNYDHLLETAIKDMNGHVEPRVVTNRQPIEIADIIPANARNFVFKYHGDISDTESIVLCREQYRRIQLEYPGTIRALSTLLATRPVLMIGFGLRDPDFLMVQDELVSTFQGQAGEYFALQPDFDPLRADYWRKNYRTEVISYDTVEKPNGGRDHSALLALVEKIRSGPRGQRTHRPRTQTSPDHVLSIARLAAAMSRERPSSVETVLPLRVEHEPIVHYGYPGHLSELIRSYDDSFLLLGLPGAGKTFSLKSYVAELADVVTERCLTDSGDLSGLHIPLFADLTLYSGDLRALLESKLSVGLKLDDVLLQHKCTVILDAANEMPREYIENGRWISDFSELRSEFSSIRFIIGCRNETWIRPIELPTFVIGDIDSRFVARELAGTVPDKVLADPDLLGALTRPLLFSLAKNRELDVSQATTLLDLYKAYWANLDIQWQAERGEATNLADALQTVAYEMLSHGVDYAGKDQFEHALARYLSDPGRALAMLLRVGALVALSGHRLTFRHQTLTEFLAAKVVGRLFEDNSDVITSLLADKRWDQTLFLAAGLLQEETARDFVERILAVDIEAAARAAYYIEDGSHAVIQFILDEAIKRVQSNDHVPHLEWAFARLPFSKARHVGSLEILAKTKSSLGGVAAGRLFCMLPQRRKTLIGSGFRHHNDFYYVGAYIRTSDTCWGQKDILYLLKKLSDPHRPWNDALSNYSELVSQISESDLPHVCATFLGTPSPARRIIIEGLTNVDAPFATRILRAAVAEGDRRGMFSLYLHLKYHRRQCDPAELPADANVIGFICDVLKSDSDADASWIAAGLGQQLTAINTEWAEGFRRHASEGGVSERLLIEIIVAHLEQRATPINEALKHLSELKLSEIIVIAHDDFWNAAPPENIIELMETREPWLVAHLPTYLWKPRQEFPILRTYPLDWWLDWIEECHLRLEEKWEWKNAGLVLRHILLERSSEGVN